MGRWIQWYLLAWLTGSPIGSLVALAVIWWAADRFTFRFLPDPLRLLGRWRRRERLRQAIGANPNDRRARFELAQLLLESRRPAAAIEVLRPNLEAGDDDVHTAFVYGAALARTGAHDAAERVLAVAREAEPGYRMGEIDLELGRSRLARGDAAGAREALARLVAERPGTVEGRFHLARALDAAGEPAAARAARDDAWREYLTLPRFRRREERRFAWRIKPWRPIAIAAALALAGALIAQAIVPAISSPAAPPAVVEER